MHSTQSVSSILDVKDGIIVTKDNRFCKLMEFSPVNFELRSPDEQAAIIAQFSAVIRTWPRVVHMKIVSTKSDVEPFIADLQRAQGNELEGGNRFCADMIENQIELIRDISQTQGVSRAGIRWLAPDSIRPHGRY